MAVAIGVPLEDREAPSEGELKAGLEVPPNDEEKVALPGGDREALGDGVPPSAADTVGVLKGEKVARLEADPTPPPGLDV